jgi:S1-C subfamily serine protease
VLPLVLALVGLCALALGGAFFARSVWKGRQAQDIQWAEPRPVDPRGELMDIEKGRIQVYKQTRPSVVHITTLQVVAGPYRFGGGRRTATGTGTGFVWNKGGFVVTNHHVVENAQTVRVTMADQKTYVAEVVGTAPDKDLAVLRIGAPQDRLVPILLGTSDDLQVGQTVYALGNPYGLDQTLTAGIVSALGREILTKDDKQSIKGAIQTDAAINPGNSGGPLLDSAGRLIGVNTAIYSKSGASAGIGFAIPVDEVRRVVPQLIAHGKIVRPSLGVDFLPDQVARTVKLTGAVIREVRPGGPAAEAKLRGLWRDEDGNIRIGDVVVGIDGQKVEKVKDVYDVLDKKKVGDTVKLDVLHDDAADRRETVEVTLGPEVGDRGR